MMKAIFPLRTVGILLVFLSVTIYSPRASALDIDPKTKTVLTMAGYGAVGGALLGTASLAFGTTGRAISVGASLGLYAGLIFGTYVIVSHRMKNYNPGQGPQERNYYPDSEGVSPYSGNPRSNYDWFGGGGQEEDPQQGQYWQQMRIQQRNPLAQETVRKMNHWSGQSPNDRTLVYLDFVKYSF